MNGAVYVFCGVLKCVVASAAEADLALFLNTTQGRILCIALHGLGHKQLPAPMHCNNVTVTGIANDTSKKKQPRSIVMRFVGSQIKLS